MKLSTLPKISVAVCTAVTGALLFTTAASATQSATSQVRLGGLAFSSLGTGPVGEETPGVESVTLLNYAYTVKNLKGYTLRDAAGNVVPLCKWLVDCTSTTGDHDADAVVNASDSDAWLDIPARSQMVVNVEGRNDGPLLNNGGDTIYLRNSVGTVLSVLRYSVSNPTG